MDTNQASTTGNDVAVGERVRYRITVTIPQGTTPGTVITDTLPDGLVFDSVASASAAGSLSSSLTEGSADRPPGQPGRLGKHPDLGPRHGHEHRRRQLDRRASLDRLYVYVLNVAGNQTGRR
ncbi:MAG: isopeptide-forming domain-containing fimbrial protein [Isosphaeraceae bacterium]